MNAQGFIAPDAAVQHSMLSLGGDVFIGKRVVIYQHQGGGRVELRNSVHLHPDSIIENGQDGSVVIGRDMHIQTRCQFSAFRGPIQIGCGVQIAPNCGFYSYDHSFAPGELISRQPLKTRGGITIEDDVWIGFGGVVLDGVRIGKGAVIAARAVVNRDVPPEGIAAGVPARVVKTRGELAAGAAS